MGGRWLFLYDRGRGHEDFAGIRSEMVDKLGMMAFHVAQNRGVGNLPGAMILVTDEAQAVLTDDPRAIGGLLGMTVVLGEKRNSDEEKNGNK